MANISLIKIVSESRNEVRGRNFKTLAKVIDSKGIEGFAIRIPGRNGVKTVELKGFASPLEMAKHALHILREEAKHLGDVEGWVTKPHKAWDGYYDLSPKFNSINQEKADLAQKKMEDELTAYYRDSRYTGD